MRVHEPLEPLDQPHAVGRLTADGPWIGFMSRAGTYRLVVGLAEGIRLAEADLDLLLALAIAYFTEALDGPPPEVQATQADLSALVARLAEGEADPRRRSLLTEALDAIDDGLAGDAVASRLGAARTPDSQKLDPIEMLRTRGQQIAEGG